MAKVFLVDDEPPVLEILTSMLVAGGHDVVQGGHGADIWINLSTQTFDLVVTDLNMPEVDGWEVAQWVTDNRPGIPVLAVSGNVGNLQPDQLRSFTAILSKPVRRQVLLHTVDSLLGKQQDSSR